MFPASAWLSPDHCGHRRTNQWMKHPFSLISALQINKSYKIKSNNITCNIKKHYIPGSSGNYCQNKDLHSLGSLKDHNLVTCASWISCQLQVWCPLQQRHLCFQHCFILSGQNCNYHYVSMCSLLHTQYRGSTWHCYILNICWINHNSIIPKHFLSVPKLHYSPERFRFCCICCQKKKRQHLISLILHDKFIKAKSWFVAS